MLGRANAIATIAVKDLDKARTFYRDTLGLTIQPATESEVLDLKSGETSVLVYKSEFAGTNKATAATWFVGKDLRQSVEALKAKGVSFEHYDFPGMQREGDIHHAGSQKAAWLKDPDGNILALIGE